MRWSNTRRPGRLRRPEPARAWTARVTVAHLSCREGQAEGVADGLLDLSWLVGHEIPGGLGRQRHGVRGDLVIAHRLPGAENGLADEALFAGAVGEDAVKGAPARLADALARQHPDAVIGAEGHHILQAQAMQRTDERAALAVPAVGQHDTEPEAHGEQLFHDLNGQLRLGLLNIAGLEAGPAVLDTEEQAATSEVGSAARIAGQQ